ncbi:MAG: Molybdopterin oxidoreductase subunitprotein [Labilithrix sp.]|nr:Molybdopterin oxidoreductase subunitprotein [Labilithrix sp.]
MKPLFPQSANAIYWLAIGALAVGGITTPVALVVWARTPYATGEQEAPPQPVKFDHRHHVRDVGIDCLYCHGSAQHSPRAGVPATSVCMGCHNQIWPDSPELAPVRASYFEQKPLVWNRVNNLPDHVFFAHSVHVNRGVGCVSCHGRVDQMAQVYQAKSLTMDFCIDCHRAPEPRLQPLDTVTRLDWEPLASEGSREELGKKLGAELGVRHVTDCSGCHR